VFVGTNTEARRQEKAHSTIFAGHPGQGREGGVRYLEGEEGWQGLLQCVAQATQHLIAQPIEISYHP